MIVAKRAEHVNYYERELLNGLLKVFGARQKVVFIKSSFDVESPRFAKMAASLELESHRQNDVVFRKGEPGEYFYIVIEGVYCVESENVQECRKTKNIFYYPGDSFGEVSLIYGMPRGATIVAHKDSSLLRIPKHVFVECGDIEAATRYLNAFFHHHLYFEREDAFMIRVVASLSKLARFAAAQVLVEEGHPTHEIIFFSKGQAHVYKRLHLLAPDGHELQEVVLVGKLKAGDVFGEKFYLHKEPSTLRVVAVEPGELVKVSFKDNINTIETPLYRRIRQNAARFPTDDEYLEKYKLFLKDRMKKLAYLTSLKLGQGHAGEELEGVRRAWARVKDCRVVK